MESAPNEYLRQARARNVPQTRTAVRATERAPADALDSLEEFRERNAKATHDLYERVKTEVSVSLFDICKIAAVDSSHEGKLILRKSMLLTKFFDSETDFVSYIRLLHKRMLLIVLF